MLLVEAKVVINFREERNQKGSKRREEGNVQKVK